ncbi:uncharacterized protein [Nicotiana tomentosiformis]|uniref:uncharacterized protein n=1 Tax=Nicotiana tomentosiformis TaxID=4098 RepID=UPI00388C8025
MAPYKALYGDDVVLLLVSLNQVKLSQERFRTTQTRKKNYAERKVYDVSFIEVEKILLRVSPMKEVTRFGKKVQLDGDLTYEEEPLAILDQQVQKFRSKDIPSMKVHWRGQLTEEAAWLS